MRAWWVGWGGEREKASEGMVGRVERERERRIVRAWWRERERRLVRAWWGGGIPFLTSFLNSSRFPLNEEGEASEGMVGSM